MKKKHMSMHCVIHLISFRQHCADYIQTFTVDGHVIMCESQQKGGLKKFQDVN